MATKTFKIGLSATDRQNMAQDVYERVLALTFAEYDSTKTYNTGDFVVYNNDLYKCKEDNVTGTWDSSKWESATLQDLLDDVESAVASVSGKADIVALENGTLVPAKSLVAEQLENVSEDSGTTQDKPFVFQGTATDGGTGASDTAPTAKYLKLKGQTYTFNQLVPYSVRSSISGLSFNMDSSTGYLTITGTTNEVISNAYIQNTDSQRIAGHKYLYRLSMISGSVDVSGRTTTSVDNGYHFDCNLNYNFKDMYLYSKGVKAVIITENTNSSSSQFIRIWADENVVFTNAVFTIEVIDLTQLFNGDIPDAILNGVELEDYGLTFSGIDIFNQLFPLPYYAYNTGTLVSANATQLTTIGYNQFDGELEQGRWDGDGTSSSDNTAYRSKNYIRAIQKQKYTIDASGESSSINRVFLMEYDMNYNFIRRNEGTSNSKVSDFTLTDNTKYVKFYCKSSSTLEIPSNPKIALHLTWDGTRTGYEHYVKHEYALGSELKEHPLLSAGSVCDEKLPDGTITRNVGSYTFTGSETWSKWTYGDVTLYYLRNNDLGLKATLGNIACDKYVRSTELYAYVGDKTIGVDSNFQNDTIYIRDDSISTANDMATAMAGKTIYYEKAIPTTEQGDSFPAVVEVDDFGTMGYGGTNYNGYPQGCEFFYPADYVLYIDTLGNATDWQPSKLALKTDLVYKELDSANVGEITTATITTGFYKNSIAITSGLSTAIDVRVQMSNGAIYPAINNGGTELVIFNGTNFQTSGTSVTKVYWKN